METLLKEEELVPGDDVEAYVSAWRKNESKVR
jgi:hypothetical protein